MPPVILTSLEREIASRRTHRRDPDRPAAHRRPRSSAATASSACCSALVTFAVVATLASAMAALRVLDRPRSRSRSACTRSQKERHLQRLEALHRDECSIHLDVADSILRSGALRTPTASCSTCATRSSAARPRLAEGAADAMLAHCACVRLVGPSGETPLAAVCDFGDAGIWLDPSAAHEAAERHEPIRRGAPDGRTVIAVPLEHRYEVVGVLEVISGPDEPYSAYDAELVVGVRPRRGVRAAEWSPRPPTRRRFSARGGSRRTGRGHHRRRVGHRRRDRAPVRGRGRDGRDLRP